MSPRIIQIPLSGGDRKAQAKGIRAAHGLHDSYYKDSLAIRTVAEVEIRKADELECIAWNAIMWAGGPAMPHGDEPVAQPTIAKALNAGFDLLEVKCNRCRRVSIVPLRSLKRPPERRFGSLRSSCAASRVAIRSAGASAPTFSPSPSPGQILSPTR